MLYIKLELASHLLMMMAQRQRLTQVIVLDHHILIIIILMMLLFLQRYTCSSSFILMFVHFSRRKKNKCVKHCFLFHSGSVNSLPKKNVDKKWSLRRCTRQYFFGYFVCIIMTKNAYAAVKSCHLL